MMSFGLSEGANPIGARVVPCSIFILFNKLIGPEYNSASIGGRAALSCLTEGMYACVMLLTKKIKYN